MKIKSIIVEDELLAQQTLLSYLNKYCPVVEVIATAQDANEALEVIRSTAVDLVFLDVELPFGNAFDLLEKLGTIRFETIFITAYAEYAMEALNNSASHYILKPIGIEELIKAVDKVEQLIFNRQSNQDQGRVKDFYRWQQRKFVFPNLKGFELIDLSQIIHCKADDNYTDFYLADGTRKIVSKTLKKVEEQLKDYGFLRVHKSHLVNLNHILSYQKGKTGLLLMSNQDKVSITSSKKQILMEILDLK